MEDRKNTILLFVILALAAVTLAYVFISGTNRPVPAYAPADGTAQVSNSVTVYGQGKVYIEPDIAYITFGCENLDLDPKKAQDDNSEMMDKIIKAVKAAGIDDADIQTAQYNVYPEYDYYSGSRTFKGFRVTNTIQVKVREVGKSGGLIKTAYDAGANLFNGIAFDVIDRQEAYIEALNDAMGRAKEKAEKLAADSGRSVTGVINIVESSSYSSPYSPQSNYVYAAAESISSYGGDSISSGQLEITAVVTVTYGLN